ncbi:hypothetical protein Dimus_003703 [Dionaea muscipula]
MGCICSKGISNREYVENGNRETESKSSMQFVTSPSKDEVKVAAGVGGGGGGNGATTGLISKGQVNENNRLNPIIWEGQQKNAEIKEKSKRPQLQRHSTMDVVGHGRGYTKMSRVVSVPNGVEVAHVNVCWPSWLISVAGEAINGWVPRDLDSFKKLEKIGQGTYSSVYRGRDLETRKIVAMKKVRFVNMDPDSVRFMAREILILRKLDHPNVMKLECIATSRGSNSLYLIFEYMEHDLAGLAARPGVKFTEAQIKCYMQQLLRGLEHCHSRGVLHRDIKGSNLLIDCDGNLKIGDFGLATCFGKNQKHAMTSRVVTLWYRPPELLLGSTDYGVSVDLWSSGCILAELFYGKPIMPGRTEVEQLHKIYKLCGSPAEDYWRNLRLPNATIFRPQQPYKRALADMFKDLSRPAMALLDVLLSVEPKLRGSASMALKTEFFTTKPLPCDPSTLPKYPPSKEYDARRQDNEAKRQKTFRVKGLGHGHESKRDPRQYALSAADANVTVEMFTQLRYGPSIPKSSGEKFNTEEDGGSGFRMEPQGVPTQNVVSLPGQSISSNSLTSSQLRHRKEADEVRKDQIQVLTHKPDAELRTPRSCVSRGSFKLSGFTSSFEGSIISHLDKSSKSAMNLNSAKQLDEGYSQPDDEVSSEKLDCSHYLLNGLKSSIKKDEGSSAKLSHVGDASLSHVHCSEPLLPPGGNIDEMLKEHEKKIQHAVRKARIEKKKTKKTGGKAYSGNKQSECLLQRGKKAR